MALRAADRADPRGGLAPSAGPRRDAAALEPLLDDPYPLARLIARAALERRESRGPHRRTDHPLRDPALDGVHLVIDPAGRCAASAGPDAMLLGVDVGGTFTDAVLDDGRSLYSAKAPTTPDDQSAGVLAAIAATLERAGSGASEVTGFAHGMTVGTNALLTGAGARTALIATRGFTDLLDVGRQNRPHLYRLCAPKAAPLVAEWLRFAPLMGRPAREWWRRSASPS